MSDLIDRQAAIDAILAITNFKTVRELYEFVQMHRFVQRHNLMERWIGGVNDAIDAVIDAPSAQRWIPVEDEEQLPREGQRVLITDEYSEIDIAYYIDHSDIGEGIEWWAHDCQCYPIAWSKIPEPYREENE